MMNAGNQGLLSSTRSSSLCAGAASVAAQCPDTPPAKPPTLEDELDALAKVLEMIESTISRLDTQLVPVSHESAPVAQTSAGNTTENLPAHLERVRLLRYEAIRYAVWLCDISNRLAL